MLDIHIFMVILSVTTRRNIAPDVGWWWQWAAPQETNQYQTICPTAVPPPQPSIDPDTGHQHGPGWWNGCLLYLLSTTINQMSVSCSALCSLLAVFVAPCLVSEVTQSVWQADLELAAVVFGCPPFYNRIILPSFTKQSNQPSLFLMVSIELNIIESM